MSAVPAHWEIAPKINALRNAISPGTVLIGNGDVPNMDEARQRTAETGFDGVMIGRGAFGNPWLFSGRRPDIKERLERLVAHAELFEKLYKSNQPDRLKSFDIMKKHFKAYVSGFDEAKDLRMKLMEAENAADVRNIVCNFNAKETVI
jgi:tRNA-dihydrouridine synthase B